MAPSIVSLPTELLEPILETLTIVEISKLQRCSKALNTLLDPFLFSSTVAVNRLMRWGCRFGEKWAIEKALSYGADINVVDCESYRAYTLCLTARQHHYDAFQFLLESGAQVGVKGIHRRQRRRLRKCLFNPQNPKLLQLYLKHQSRDTISGFCSGLDQALLSSVQMNLGLETCRAWVDLGADPTRLLEENTPYPKSVLALAILSGSVPLVRVLLSKNPDLSLLNVRLVCPDPTVEDRMPDPLEAIPMLAAARHIATSGTTIMMDLLLEARGNINDSVISDPKVFWVDRVAPSPCPSGCIFTPLLMYVLTVDINAAEKDISVTPSQAVKYLLDQGAEIEQPGFVGVREQRRAYPTLLELMWKTWGGLKCLLNDEAYAVLKLVIENGAAEGAVAELLLPSGVQLAPSPDTQAAPFSSEDYRLLMGRWETLLELILTDENFELGLSCEIDDLFFQFIMKIFWSTLHPRVRLPDPCPTEMVYQYVDESHPTTIQKLLEKGANINMKMERHDFYESLLGSIHRSRVWGINPLQMRRQRSFVRMLINLGAKPFTPSREDGVDDADPMQRQWLAALRGEGEEEDSTLWNPRSNLLFVGSSDNRA